MPNHIKHKIEKIESSLVIKVLILLRLLGTCSKVQSLIFLLLKAESQIKGAKETK
jgi:hypothetical protein